ncbi:hypothetical protein AAOE16_00140, partial [Ekhidna sp. MALMAid0563]|uniref:hypothetical protein n=1 Tax=Ekhidna sp. MALMAid0563 TaxID=3143937 RepID=UPI0032DE544A
MRKLLICLLPLLISFVSIAQPSTGAITVTGGSGTGGAFIVGDVVTSQWNSGSDGASGITSVNFDFTEFGGGPAVLAGDIGGGIYEATYTIAAPGTTESTTADVTITVVATVGSGTTTDDEDHTVDDILPTATVTTDSDPIYQGDLTQVVTVTYDESMDNGTSPTIGFDNSVNFTSNLDGAWSTTTFTDDTWTETFTH